MTIEEAIEHCEETAYLLDKQMDDGFHDEQGCMKCRDEHLQLAEWLKELLEKRERLEEIKKICDECFPCDDGSNPEWSRNIDIHRSQALANVYGVIIYNGKNIVKEGK